MKAIVKTLKINIKMEQKIFSFLTCLLALMGFAACSSDSLPIAEENLDLVPVEITFGGLDVSVLPESPMNVKSRATATEAGVTRIALKVFDYDTNAFVTRADKKKENDADFDHAKLKLRVGRYKLLAVAHEASDVSLPVAYIENFKSIWIKESKVPRAIYVVGEEVVVKDNASKSITINFGKRKSSTFIMKPTDTYPTDVKKVQVVVNPDHTTAQSPIKFFTAGRSQEELTYVNTVTLPENGSFDGQEIKTNVLLFSGDEQKMKVIIKMLSADDKVLYTRTLNDVPFKMGRDTRAEGNFFDSSVTGGFNFDITDEPEVNVPLDPNN